MPKKFQPVSNFFIEHTNLDAPNLLNNISDSFGPVTDSSFTKFQVTSFLRALGSTNKVYAINDGRVLLQPMTGDDTKLNLIIKNTNSKDYAPLKIKYFIYRGVNKSDLVDSNNFLKVKNLNDNLQPTFLQELWDKYHTENPNLPSTFSAELIGLDIPNQPASTLLEEIFFKFDQTTLLEGQLPNCKRGDYLANFTGKIGLDIILDIGDYSLEDETELFVFDLRYARYSSHIFDVELSPISPDTEKQYKQYTTQFIDASAFWGAHIDSGQIFLGGGVLCNDIYNDLIKYYQTKNRVYLYIEAERNRSYNYYPGYTSGKIDFKLMGPTAILTFYEVSGWPVYFKEFPFSSTDYKGSIQFSINYVTDPNTLLIYPHSDGNPSLESYQDLGLASFNILEGNIIPIGHSGFLENPNDPNSPHYSTGTLLKFKAADLSNNPDYNKISIARFYLFVVKGMEDLPLQPYYNDLWLSNIKNNFSFSQGGNSEFSHWVHDEKYHLKNITQAIELFGALLKNKIFFDNGKNSSGLRLKRRLYISLIDQALTQKWTSGFEKKLTDENYSLVLYGDSSYEVFRGSIVDDTDSFTSKSTLMLVHKTHYKLKQNFIHLGITEDEYLSLRTSLSPLAKNITLDLTEINVTGDFRKFAVGLKFEINQGIIETKYQTIDKVYVYTIDNFYFSSHNYAEYQTVVRKFANSEVHFRPAPNWNYDFGFDWIRKGDTLFPSDTVSPINRNYKNVLGRYYDPVIPSKKLEDDEIRAGNYNITLEKKQFLSYQKSFLSYPLLTGITSVYSSAWLALYPSLDSGGEVFPKLTQNNTLKCLIEALIEIQVNVYSLPQSLKIKFPKLNLSITPFLQTATTVLPDVNEKGIVYAQLEIADKAVTSINNPRKLEFTIKCLKEFDEIIVVQVIATESNIERIAGSLCLMPNNKSHRKEINLSFINVRTDLNTNPLGSVNNGYDNGNKFLLENEITKTLNQALVNIKTISQTDLNLLSASHQLFYDQYAPPANIFPDTSIRFFSPINHDDLIAMLPSNTPKNGVVIFCINEFAGWLLNQNENDILAGAAQETPIWKPVIILYRSGLYKTSLAEGNVSSHELMHCLYLYHSFSPYNLFSFKMFITDNIMDYKQPDSDSPYLSPTNFRKVLNFYQWEIIRNSKNIRNEI